jgi:hypothetical protein
MFENGVALSEGESAHPELWAGLKWAVDMRAGPTGTKLRDFGPQKDFSSFVNVVATDWQVSKQGHVLNFDAASTRVTTNATINHGIQDSQVFTWLALVKPNSTPGTWDAIWGNGVFSPAIYLETSGGNGWGLYSPLIRQSGLQLTAGVWYSLCVVQDANNLYFWTNGDLTATLSTITFGNNNLQTLGSSSYSAGEHGDQQIAYCYLYNRVFGSELITRIAEDLNFNPFVKHGPVYIPIRQTLAVNITGSASTTPLLSVQAPLAATLNGSALLTGDVENVDSLIADITGSATFVGQLTLPPLSVDITSNALVGANLETPQPLVPWGGISCTATVTALLDKNLQHTSSSLSLTQSASHFNFDGGNTLVLIQSATVELVSNISASNSLTLISSVDFVGTITESVESVLGTLNHSVIFVRTLPTETASNTLTLTSTTDFARAAQNTLNLTSTAVGSIGGIEESASNTLSLTSTATVDTILLLNLTSDLILTHTAIETQVTLLSPSNTLTFNQTLLNVTLGTKKYVILQAPFDSRQVSVVLPNPLWGDTENITSEMSLRRSMNGRKVTHVKTNKNRRVNYTFRLLDKPKALELLEFCRYYNSDLIRLQNWKGEIWKVNLLTNPIDFVQTRRYGTDVALEFEGELING